MPKQFVTIDGNQAAAHVAYRTNEVIAIYPITPSSPMGEWADQWRVENVRNLWGTTPVVQEMQSEGGAAGAVHGALQAGSLTTTFTASQGLLLMIPNMYKIAGELTPTVFHIAARSIAAQALSIFGDHSDVMATRSAGWGMLFAASVQEVHDFALITQAATLEARVPFLHVFDGFRTSHEVTKVELLPDETIRAMINDEFVRAHRGRALSPDHPFIRGTAQNPDTFFQARETVNPYYQAVPEIVRKAMDRFADLTGRRYGLFDYVGAPDAERVIVMMGSGAEAAAETATYLADRGERVGVVKVRLFRPFDATALLSALPMTVKTVAVLDRTKEPGSAGEPLYQDIVTALAEAHDLGVGPATTPRTIGGRYGLSSKEFTPAMVKGIFDEMKSDRPHNHFTIGIRDDVTDTSLDYAPEFEIEPDDVVRAVFWGLGSDGTVGANKNSVKIIGEGTPLFAQGYFVYDSRKAGARTISHLRFGPRPIRSSYLIRRATFVACHQFDFLEHYDVLEAAEPGATFLLNSPYKATEVWDHLPQEIQLQIIDKGLDFYVIDAHAVAKEVGLEGRINTVMQPCFFALSKVLPLDDAIPRIKESIRKTYGRRGEVVVRRNFEAVDAALERLEKVTVPDIATSELRRVSPVSARAPAFVQAVTAAMIAGEGNSLPVSALPADGTYPSGTTRWEKRNLAQEVPEWVPDLCIQCGKCVLVCPHAVIRSKLVPAESLESAPDGFPSSDSQWREMPDHQYVLSVSVEDCTGCELCVEICPAVDKANPERKALNMVPQRPLREKGAEEWDFFLGLPEVDRADGLRFNTVRNVQLLEPLFEFSSACSGCGETPYIKLLTQLFGDRALVANATGCSSIYGGNMPTTPWSFNAQGRGPAWSNSLFEDNAEFGLGMRLTLDKQVEYASELVASFGKTLDPGLSASILESPQDTDAEIAEQRVRVARLKELLREREEPVAKDLLALADVLVKRSVWLLGGDGWAYDIGYGGLDHVLASGRNVNVLVLDTEVYSNTGGQASKATPLAAVARFAAGGKPTGKKDLGRMAMVYGNVYVAQVAMGGSDAQLVRAFLEAESYPGPSLIIAYGHCIAHGIDMSKGLQQQKLAVDAGYWPLFRYDPRREEAGRIPFQLDSRAPSIPLKEYAYNENRYRVLAQTNPEAAAELLDEAQQAVEHRWHIYEEMAGKKST